MGCERDASARRGGLPSGRRVRAFTLIELMVVIAIIAVLAALGLAVAGVVRQQARVSNARSTVSALHLALEAYKQEDAKFRYPLHEELYLAAPAAPHLVGRSAVGSAYPGGLVGLLIDRSLLPLGAVKLHEDGRLLDPWDGQFRFHLRRPVPTANAARLADWNWDAALSRAARWNEATNLAAPYPYIFSLGPTGSAADAAGWIYHAR